LTLRWVMVAKRPTLTVLVIVSTGVQCY
jgi:hypothetical protein